LSGSILKAGTNPTLSAEDIDGNAIPDINGDYPIGCHVGPQIEEDDMSTLITAKRTLGFKLESTPYTAETLAVTDYDVAAFNINYDVDVPVKDRKLARGDYSHDVGVAGKRKFSCSFSVDLNAATASNGTYDPDAAPTFWKCLRACGLTTSTHGTTGISLKPNANYSGIPATIEIVEKDEGASPSQLVIKASGCMGNPKIVAGSVGEPIRIDFEFQGALVSITDRAFGSILTPTGFSALVPEALLGATCTLFAEAQRIGACTIDLGNQVELFSDMSKASGYEGAHVVARDVVADIDPDMDLIANRGNYARQIANTTGAFVLQTNRFTITAPVAQIIQAYKPGEREGHVTSNIRVRCTRDTNGNDELTILQGTTA
jgi:hypothetical protein